MSYSFSAKGCNKKDAMAAVAAKFDEIVTQQPIHARDRAAVLANAGAAIDMLTEDVTQDVAVTCNGYLTWTGTGEYTPEGAAVGGCSIAANAYYAKRERPDPAHGAPKPEGYNPVA